MPACKVDLKPDTCEVFENILVEWLWSFILQLKSSNFQLEPLLHHLYVNL